MKKRVCILGLALTLLGSMAVFAKKESKLPDSYAFTRGMEAFQEGNRQDALDWFNKEVREYPDNGYAFLYISAMRYTNDEYGKALTAINEALKRLPKKDKVYTALAYDTRAKIYLDMLDTISALKDFDMAVKLEPDNTEHYDARGQVYFEMGRYDLSDADYQKIISLDPGNVMGYMGVGRNAKNQGKWDDAIKQFDYAIKLAPDYSNGYSYRAEAYIGQEKWNEATDDIVKALDIDGDNKAYYLMQNLSGEASNLLKSKLKIQMMKQPTNVYWPYCLAVLSDSLGDHDEAVSYYEKANSLDANPLLLENIANCYYNLKQYDKALDYVDRALALDPEDYEAIDLKADILSRLGRYDESLAERDKYISKYPGIAVSYLFRADDLMSARKFNEAIDDYNTSAVIVPLLSDSSYLLMRRGDAYRYVGKDAEAKKDYEHLLEVEKDSVLTANSWSPFAYSGLGNKEKAIETMQYILANDTSDVSGTLYNAACVYARVGRPDDALKYLSEAIANGYDNRAHAEVDYDLDILRNLPEFQRLIESISPAGDTPAADKSEVKDEVGKVEIVEIPFTKEAGVTKVKCSINDLPLHFVFDTGAAEVTISMVEASFMLKNDYIKPDDIIGSARYVDANGDISEGTVINLRNVNFGGLELDNVRASVVRNQKAPLLLGQSVLGRLGKIEIDNPGMKLIITHKK